MSDFRVPTLYPVREQMRPGDWEHTPLDYYRYGEYPRFLRPVGAHRPQVTTRKPKEPK